MPSCDNGEDESLLAVDVVSELLLEPDERIAAMDAAKESLPDEVMPVLLWLEDPDTEDVLELVYPVRLPIMLFALPNGGSASASLLKARCGPAGNA
jgi:hypothetical protein